MTYTFKLARRLAVSRRFGMVPVFILFLACNGGDATAPESSPGSHPSSAAQEGWRRTVPVAVNIKPSHVTVETNQLIRFLANGRNRDGDTISTPIIWKATGGTILPDGRFSSPAVGTFMITGRSRIGDEDRIDTAKVVVVRRYPQLESIHVTPGTPSLAPGGRQQFLVTGRLKDGRAVPVGAVWRAGGGTIDPSGNYVAGDTAGSFLVVASNPVQAASDTAVVNIVPSAPPPPPPATAPPESTPSGSPPPVSPSDPPAPSDTTTPTKPVDTMPPAPLPPPRPVLAKVTLLPVSATLARGTTRKFVAYGRSATGDSIAVSVVFAATGGTVTSAGLYTAGSAAGTFRVIAKSSGIADTSTVTVTVPLASGPVTGGIPFGVFHLPIDSLNSPSLNYNGALMNGYAPTLKASLDKVRARKGRVVLSLLRSRTKDPLGRLSVAVAKAELESWAAAVDLNPYLADGTIVGIYVSDDIAGADHWGGEVPPLARIDSLALAVKTLWPNAITMVRARPSQLKYHTPWRWLEAAWAQYNGPYRHGTPESFRDTEVATAKSLGLGLVLSFNLLNGGCGPTTECLPGVPGSSVYGTYPDPVGGHWYQLSAAEILHYGKVFIAEPYSCGFIAWQWSPIFKRSSLSAEQLAGIRAFDSRPDIRAAMAQLSVQAAQRANTSCRQR